MDLVTINIQAQIAFGIFLIAALLTYIAFFKDSKSQQSSKRPHK